MKHSVVLLLPVLLVITLTVSHTEGREDSIYHFDDKRAMYSYLDYLLSYGFMDGTGDAAHNRSSISSVMYCCYVDWDMAQEGQTLSELIDNALNDTTYY